jgi:serine/threonine protein kinase
LNPPAIPAATTEDMDDEELMAMAAMAPPTALGRETTQQWLKNSSAFALRDTVCAEVALEDFERHSILGEGQFGSVWLVTADLDENLGGRNHFALKIQKKDDPTRGNSVEAVKREIDVLALMDHPFIVNLVHHYEDQDNLYILMGLVHGGELFDLIHHQDADGLWCSGIPESDAKFYAMVVADTLDYMHRKNFIFRDLKPENILIDKDGYPVLCDLGFGTCIVFIVPCLFTSTAIYSHAFSTSFDSEIRDWQNFHAVRNS